MTASERATAAGDDPLVSAYAERVAADRRRREYRGHRIHGGDGPAERILETATRPELYCLASVASADVAAHRRMSTVSGDRARRATRIDRTHVLNATPGRRLVMEAATNPGDWAGPQRRLRAR